MPFEQHLSDPDLWRRICEYEFPTDTRGVSFAQHLVQVSKWSERDVFAAIEEYRRFAYISTFQKHALVAPHVVNRVWAQHRAYGSSYERDFLPLIGAQDWQPFSGSHHQRGRRLLNAELYYEREFGERFPKFLLRREEIWRYLAAGVLVAACLCLSVVGGWKDMESWEWNEVIWFVAMLCSLAGAKAIYSPNRNAEIPLPDQENPTLLQKIYARWAGL